MAINLLSACTVPNPVAGDWSNIVNLVTKLYKSLSNPIKVIGTDIPQGASFQVGDAVYYADSDTAISGTPSSYVKLTISGTTLVPSFVTSLSGVTWNPIYNGWYDTSGNLYIFNEAVAYAAGQISEVHAASPVVNHYGGVGGSAVYGAAIGRQANASYGAAIGDRATAAYGGATGAGASTTQGGAIGYNATAAYGGAVGFEAVATQGGAVGYNAEAENGGAIGQSASATNGGAIGYNAEATTGGAIGNGAQVTNGFAGGDGAVAIEDKEINICNYIYGKEFASTDTEATVHTWLRKFGIVIILVNYDMGAIGHFNYKAISFVRILTGSGNIELHKADGSIVKTIRSGNATAIGSPLFILLASRAW